MLITHKIVASIMVFTAAFFALGAGARIDPTGALLASSALAMLTLLMLAATARRRAEVRAHARGLALADAEGLMRMDSDKG